MCVDLDYKILYNMSHLPEIWYSELMSSCFCPYENSQSRCKMMQPERLTMHRHAPIDIYSLPTCGGGGLGNSAKAPEVILLEIPAWLVTHEPVSDKLDATCRMNQMHTWCILMLLI